MTNLEKWFNEGLIRRETKRKRDEIYNEYLKYDAIVKEQEKKKYGKWNAKQGEKI